MTGLLSFGSCALVWVGLLAAVAAASDPVAQGVVTRLQSARARVGLPPLSRRADLDTLAL